MTYKENRFLDFVFLALYRFNNSYLRKTIRRLMLRREDAGFYSRTVRRLLLVYHDVEVGMYSRGALWSELPSGTRVGRYCSLARGLIVINGSHPVRRKSTHAFFFNPDLGYVDSLLIQRRKKLTIGHDVYIGLDVTILPAATHIGTGAVIAAGSVVTKDVPPFAIVGGNPAKLIRYRFSEETIQKIKESKWWEKDIEELIADKNEFASFLEPVDGEVQPGSS